MSGSFIYNCDAVVLFPHRLTYEYVGYQNRRIVHETILRTLVQLYGNKGIWFDELRQYFLPHTLIYNFKDIFELRFEDETQAMLFRLSFPTIDYGQKTS